MRREQVVFLSLCGLLALVLVAGLQMQPAGMAQVSPLGNEALLPAAATPSLGAALLPSARDCRNPFRPPWIADPVVTEDPSQLLVDDSVTVRPPQWLGVPPPTPATITPWAPQTLTLVRTAVFDVAGHPRTALLQCEDGRLIEVNMGTELAVPARNGGIVTARIVSIESDAVVLSVADHLIRVR